MRILLVNDDGVHAPGIVALFNALKKVAQVTMVAPLEERSTTGHSLSLSQPLRMVNIEEGRYGISGFPADCVLMALGTVCSQKPDLVISGINRGGNLGQDVYYSGTVAGAREASFHGIPSLAVSLTVEFSSRQAEFTDYQVPSEFIAELVRQGIHTHIPPHHLININYPFIDPKEIQGAKMTTVGFRKYSDKVQRLIDPRSKEYYWVVGKYEGFDQDPESDCWAIDNGFISMSPIAHLEREKEWNMRLNDFIQKLNNRH